MQKYVKTFKQLKKYDGKVTTGNVKTYIYRLLHTFSNYEGASTQFTELCLLLNVLAKIKIVGCIQVF